MFKKLLTAILVTTFLSTGVYAAEPSFGVVRNVPINDITVTEARAGVFVPGTIIWVGVEGGISRGWGEADQVSIGAESVRIEGDTQMRISQPRLDSHGVYVEILRGSRNDGAQIIFSDVSISGHIIPGQEYTILIAGSAVADNWSGFSWLESGLGVRGGRGRVHGFFTLEPYALPAFSFEEEDILATISPS